MGQELTWRDLLHRLQADAMSSSPASLPPARRDESSWTEAWTRTRGLARIISLQLGLSSADAEDLTQGVMLDLQTTDLIERLDLSSSPAAYLFSTLRNRGLDLVKRRNREQPVLSAPVTVEAPPVLADAPDENEVAAAALHKELRRLPKEDLQLLRLRFWQGLSIAEIARRRSEPYSRVAVRLFRLVRRLEPRLASAGSRRGRSSR